MPARYGQGAGRILGGTRQRDHLVRHTHTPPGIGSKRVFVAGDKTAREVGSPCTSNDSPASHDRSARAIRSRKCFSPSLFTALGSSVIDSFLKDGDSFLHGDDTVKASCDALAIPLDHDDRSGHWHPY